MRSSTFLAVVAALMVPAFAAESTVVPIQQIGDGQIQNPATPLPSATASSPASSAAVTSAVVSSTVPSSAVAPSSAAKPPPASPPAVASSAAPSPPPAPPAPKPSGGGIPPSYGNVTSTLTGVNTITQSVIKPSKTPSTTPAGPASPSASKPSVQTGAANTLVGSTVGLGAAALLVAFLG